MISVPEFKKKQIVFVFASDGDKLSFSNDNLVVKNKENKIKFQTTCYKLFMVVICGNIMITSGLLQRANRFGFSICLMNRNMKMYQVINSVGEGNTLLHKHQYEYDSLELAKHITRNKILNQRDALKTFRVKSFTCQEAIQSLTTYVARIDDVENLTSLMGIEGAAAREYFLNMFNNVDWKGRRPRVKSDYVNATLDIGYNILFNLVDAILTCFGFDTYYGVMHRCFYRRKSLVCDIVEPFRPIIDLRVRKAINLAQFKEDDFEVLNHRYALGWRNSSKYVSCFMGELVKRKEDIFIYIQQYYRAFMKRAVIEDFPIYQIR